MDYFHHGGALVRSAVRDRRPGLARQNSRVGRQIASGDQGRDAIGGGTIGKNAYGDADAANILVIHYEV